MKLTISDYKSNTLWYKILDFFRMDPEDGRTIKVRFDHADDINMDVTMSYILRECVKRHRLKSNGYPTLHDEDIKILPPDLQEPGDEVEAARWLWVLDEIIWAFDYHTKNNSWFKRDEDEIRFNNAMRFFITYYRSMWL